MEILIDYSINVQEACTYYMILELTMVTLTKGLYDLLFQSIQKKYDSMIK